MPRVTSHPIEFAGYMLMVAARTGRGTDRIEFPNPLNPANPYTFKLRQGEMLCFFRTDEDVEAAASFARSFSPKTNKNFRPTMTTAAFWRNIATGPCRRGTLYRTFSENTEWRSSGKAKAFSYRKVENCHGVSELEDHYCSPFGCECVPVQWQRPA